MPSPGVRAAFAAVTGTPPEDNQLGMIEMVDEFKERGR